jgi:replicative DNA helicase
MDLTNLNRNGKRKRSIDLSTMVYGKVPPQAKDLEESVLGAIMSEKGAFDIAIEVVKSESFYVDAHRKIFKAMQSLAQKSQPIDVLTVCEELRCMKELDLVGGPYYVTKLTNTVVSSAHLEAHARIVQEKFLKREIIRVGGEMVHEAYEDGTDVFDLLDHVETSVMNISLNNVRRDFRGIDSGLVKAFQRIEHLRQLDTSLTGAPTGFENLDKITHGWQDTDLVILAARPSIGKTAFALNLAKHAAMHSVKPTPVGIFSLEMSESQLVERLLSCETGIHLERLKTGRLDDEQMRFLYSQGIQKLANAPIFIDDTAGLNMFEFRAKARRMVSKHKVKLIILDYLQLMVGDRSRNSNREQEIAQISRELKIVAKTLGIPIIALSQMSRQVEGRKGGEPQLSDLRESGAIEQDADLVAFLYGASKEDQKKDADLKNKAFLKIAKHRNGDLGEIPFYFKGWIQKWEELAEGDLFVNQPDYVPKGWKPVKLGIDPNQTIEGKRNDEDPF